jgi:hypothetical protein
MWNHPQHLIQLSSTWSPLTIAKSIKAAFFARIQNQVMSKLLIPLRQVPSI